MTQALYAHMNNKRKKKVIASLNKGSMIILLEKNFRSEDIPEHAQFKVYISEQA
jgi:hypothetical protein